MPAVEKSVKYTWLPRGAGKGGIYSNCTSHDADTDTLVDVTDFVIDGGKWCPRPADEPFYTGLSPLPGYPQAIFIFNRYNQISTNVTSILLADLDSDGSPQQNHAVYKVGATTLSQVWGPLGQYTGGGKPRVNFQSVKNRCFMTSGRGLAYADTVSATNGSSTITRTTGADFEASMKGLIVLTDYGYYRITGVSNANTLTVTPFWTGPTGGPFNFYIGWDTPSITADGTSVYTWGFPAQATNLTYHIAGPTPGSAGLSGTATAVIDGAGPNYIVTWVSGDKFDALNPDQNFYLTGYNRRILDVLSTTAIRVDGGFPAGVGAPAAFQAGFGSLIGTVTLTTANDIVWASGDTFAPTGGGDPFLVVGSAVYLGGTRHTITAVTSPTAATISTSTLPLSPPDYAFTGDFGPLVWEDPALRLRRGYLYGVAYWDPITGHASNACQVLEVSDGAPNNDGVTVVLSDIITNNDSRFTQIIIARSFLNGTTLFPLAIRPNTGGPLKYVDSIKDDTKLGTVGPGFLQIERINNLPPPASGYFTAYWDGRFWMADNVSIGVLYMSKSTQEMQSTVGVAEECWPQNLQYQRTVSESDGRITGLRTVGKQLYVLTDLSIYVILGNSPGNYILERVSAKGSGTAHFATSVLPAEDSQSGDVLVHFGNDNRMYFLYGAGGDLSYTYPIQNQLGGWVPGNTNTGVIHDKRSTYVVLERFTANFSGVFIYDLDRKAWLAASLPEYSYYEGLYNGDLVHLGGSSPAQGGPSNIYRIMANTSSSVSTAATITTQFVNVPETARLDDKRLQAVFVYCDVPSTPISVTVYVDDSTSSAYTLVQMPTIDPRYNAYLDAPNARIYQPSGSTIILGRTFRIGLLMLSPTRDSKIPAFAALWSYSTSEEASKGVI